MSNFNQNPSPQFPSGSISIDETGKVLINDAELAKMTEELSLEDLDYVAGGDGSGDGSGDGNGASGGTTNCCGGVNIGCC